MERKYNELLLAFIVGTLSSFVISGCNDNSGGGGGACPKTNVGIEVCDPETGGQFTLMIDNGFFPVVVGSESVLEGVDDQGVMVRIESSVLDEAEDIAGVTTRVVEEKTFEDDELVEDTRDFYAQAPDGTVCYFGEDVDIVENGEIVSHEGTWRAGNGNLPGIIMPANPEVGMVFNQELAPNVAEDVSSITALGETIDVPFGMFSNTVSAEDCNPFDGTKDRKVYVDGIGLSIDEAAELVEFNP
jgi:hypothetical protein